MQKPAESQGSGRRATQRAAFYVDGFNLYYAIKDLRQNHLKWIDLWSLADHLIRQRTEALVKVAFCTAYNTRRFDSLTRHQKYVRALEHFGVTTVLGHYTAEPRNCRECRSEWVEDNEKETDVNLALHLIHDAQEDVFDHAYILTADSDQAATAKFLKEHWPTKRLTTIAPPGRNFSKSILRYADSKMALTTDQLEWAVMPPTVFKDAKTVVVKRPDEYATPPGWVHPSKRPK